MQIIMRTELPTTEMSESGRPYFQRKRASLVPDMLSLRWLWKYIQVRCRSPERSVGVPTATGPHLPALPATVPQLTWPLTAMLPTASPEVWPQPPSPQHCTFTPESLHSCPGPACAMGATRRFCRSCPHTSTPHLSAVTTNTAAVTQLHLPRLIAPGHETDRKQWENSWQASVSFFIAFRKLSVTNTSLNLTSWDRPGLCIRMTCIGAPYRFLEL